MLRGGGMEARMKPGRQTAPPKPLPNPFSGKFLEDCERWRVRHFVANGFQDYDKGYCTTYRVKMDDGVGEDRLLAFLKGVLGEREIPPIVPEAARGCTLRIFRTAEAAGLLSLETACVSRLR